MTSDRVVAAEPLAGRVASAPSTSRAGTRHPASSGRGVPVPRPRASRIAFLCGIGIALVGCTQPAGPARRLAPLDGASTVAALERLASGVAPGTRFVGVASDERGLRAEFVATDGAGVVVRVAAGDVRCPGCVAVGEGTVVPEGAHPLGASLAGGLAGAIRTGVVAVRWVEEAPRPRAGFPERLRTFLAERPVLPLTGVDTTSWSDLLLAVLVSGLWLAFAGAFLAEALRELRATSRGDLVLLGAATLLAATLGVLLAGFGPGAFRLNFPGAQYGTATAGLARWVWSITGISPESLVWKNLVLGALLPAVMAFLVRSASRDRALAWTAGGLAAAQPLFVVFAGEAGPPTQVVFLAVVALWALLRVLDTGRLAPVVLHASAVWLCTESRPEAVLVVPMAWGLVWAVGKGRPSLLGVAALEAAVATVSALPWIGRVLAGAGGSQLGFAAASFGRPKYLWRPEHAVWLNPEYTAIAVVVLILCGLVVVLVRRRRLDLWVFFSMVLVAVPTCGLRTADQCLEWVRYVVLLVVFATWLAALGAVEAVRLVAVLAGRRWTLPVAVAIAAAVALTTIAPMARTNADKTVNAEFRFLLRHLRELPADAEIHYVYPQTSFGDMALVAQPDLSGLLRRPGHRWVRWSPGAPPSGAPRFFYLQAGCWSTDPNGAGDRILCREADAAYRTRPFVEAWLPSATRCEAPYEGDRLRVGFYRMDPVP